MVVSLDKRKAGGWGISKQSIKDTTQRIIPQAPYIEFKSNREALVEGCKGILEYAPEIIRINTGNMVVSFTGRGLNIKCLSATGLIVEGYILSLEFIN